MLDIVLWYVIGDLPLFFFFFFHDPPPPEIYTLSLHDALPIWAGHVELRGPDGDRRRPPGRLPGGRRPRSEEHTSELQSRGHLVCRLLLEKKKKRIVTTSVQNPKTGMQYTGSHLSQKGHSTIDP